MNEMDEKKKNLALEIAKPQRQLAEILFNHASGYVHRWPDSGLSFEDLVNQISALSLRHFE